MRGPHGSLRKTADGRGEEKPSTPSLSQGLPGAREARRSADSSPSAPPALLPLADPPLLLPQLPQISAFASRLWSPSSLRPPETSRPPPPTCSLLLPGHDRPSSQGEPAPSVPLTAREAPRAAASPSRAAEGLTLLHRARGTHGKMADKVAGSCRKRGVRLPGTFLETDSFPF